MKFSPSSFTHLGVANVPRKCARRNVGIQRHASVWCRSSWSPSKGLCAVLLQWLRHVPRHTDGSVACCRRQDMHQRRLVCPDICISILYRLHLMPVRGNNVELECLLCCSPVHPSWPAIASPVIHLVACDFVWHGWHAKYLWRLCCQRRLGLSHEQLLVGAPILLQLP